VAPAFPDGYLLPPRREQQSGGLTGSADERCKCCARQQNLSGRQIAVLVLVAADNRLETLVPLAPAAEIALATIRAGEVVFIGGPDPAANP